MKRLAVILIAVSVSGCWGAAPKIAVLETGEPYFNGLTSIHTRAVVVNGGTKDITLENAAFRFFYKERQLATARLMLPASVRAGATERVRIDLRLESESLSDLQSLQRRMETAPERLTVTVRAQVRRGNARRTVEMKDIPYSAIIATFENQTRNQ